jgi:hypothetical protein
MRLKKKKWKWRNKQMNKPARLSDSRNFRDFAQFTTNRKPSTPTVLFFLILFVCNVLMDVGNPQKRKKQVKFADVINLQASSSFSFY